MKLSDIVGSIVTDNQHFRDEIFNNDSQQEETWQLNDVYILTVLQLFDIFGF